MNNYNNKAGKIVTIIFNGTCSNSLDGIEDSLLGFGYPEPGTEIDVSNSGILDNTRDYYSYWLTDKEGRKTKKFLGQTTSILLKNLDGQDLYDLIKNNKKIIDNHLYLGVDGVGAVLEPTARFVPYTKKSITAQIALGYGVTENVDHAIMCLVRLLERGEKIDELNLNGWSRGAASAIAMAYWMWHSDLLKERLNGILAKQVPSEIIPDQIFQKLKQIKINIFAIDPVAGTFNEGKEFLTITPNVSHAVIPIAENEFSGGFCVCLPTAMDPTVTRVDYLLFPGGHSTLVCNPSWRLKTTHVLNDALNLPEAGLIVRWMAIKLLSSHGTRFKKNEEHLPNYQLNTLREMFNKIVDNLEEYKKLNNECYTYIQKQGAHRKASFGKDAWTHYTLDQIPHFKIQLKARLQHKIINTFHHFLTGINCTEAELDHYFKLEGRNVIHADEEIDKLLQVNEQIGEKANEILTQQFTAAQHKLPDDNQWEKMNKQEQEKVIREFYHEIYGAEGFKLADDVFNAAHFFENVLKSHDNEEPLNLKDSAQNPNLPTSSIVQKIPTNQVDYDEEELKKIQAEVEETIARKLNEELENETIQTNIIKNSPLDFGQEVENVDLKSNKEYKPQCHEIFSDNSLEIKAVLIDWKMLKAIRTETQHGQEKVKHFLENLMNAGLTIHIYGENAVQDTTLQASDEFKPNLNFQVTNSLPNAIKQLNQHEISIKNTLLIQYHPHAHAPQTIKINLDKQQGNRIVELSEKSSPLTHLERKIVEINCLATLNEILNKNIPFWKHQTSFRKTMPPIGITNMQNDFNTYKTADIKVLFRYLSVEAEKRLTKNFFFKMFRSRTTQEFYELIRNMNEIIQKANPPSLEAINAISRSLVYFHDKANKINHKLGLQTPFHFNPPPPTNPEDAVNIKHFTKLLF